MIAESMKQMAIVLIDEAVAAGARQHKACEVLGITSRTLRRWRRADSLQDRRKGAPRTCPHALTDEEKQTIVATCNLPQYQSLPPCQIVPVSIQPPRLFPYPEGTSEGCGVGPWK